MKDSLHTMPFTEEEIMFSHTNQFEPLDMSDMVETLTDDERDCIILDLLTGIDMSPYTVLLSIDSSEPGKLVFKLEDKDENIVARRVVYNLDEYILYIYGKYKIKYNENNEE